MHKQGTMTRSTALSPETSPFPFDIRFNSSKAAVRQALAEVRQELAPLGLDIEELQIVELVLAEALNNIVEHAYAQPVPDDMITICGDHRANGLHFRIVDRGGAMPDGKPPLGNTQPISAEIEDLPEGGFGWFLIRDLAKDVCYRRIGTENRLDLRLAIALDWRE